MNTPQLSIVNLFFFFIKMWDLKHLKNTILELESYFLQQLQINFKKPDISVHDTQTERIYHLKKAGR